MNEQRLRWLLRRGMKELDVLTERYYARRWPVAPDAERASFVKMLNTVEDPDLWSWAMGYSETPTEYQDVVEQLRRHH
jgi:antitoxin CptB